MASVTISRGTTLPNSSSKTDFHNLIDQSTGTVTNIVNADINSSAAIVASKLDLSSIGQTISMSSKPINYAQGSNIASASSIDIGAATGNYVVVTGTTTITSLGTVQAGTTRIVEFSGALTLTHNATSLILPGGANITTAAGDVAIFVSEGSGNWRCAGYSKANGDTLGFTPSASNALSGSVVQTVNNSVVTLSTGTTAIPDDDTIPQNTEGTEFFTQAITPTNASNKLKITVVFYGSSSGSDMMTTALFQDSTANALAAGHVFTEGSAVRTFCTTFVHYMTAGTTSATTFKVRVGSASSGTITMNGYGGVRKLGGVLVSSITIEEIKA